MSNIGKNITKLRKEKGITQEQLAERLHVTRQAVSHWENGKTHPDIDILTALAEYFEVSIEELIYGNKSKGSNITIENSAKTGIDVGTAVGVALAVVLSYSKWQSIGWAIIHGLFNWVYVIYYAIKY